MKADGTRHTLGDVLHERTEFDFIGRKWRWVLLSGLVIAIGVAGFAVRGGLNLGIEFEGGNAWTVGVTGTVPSVGEVRDALGPLGLSDAKISIREDRTTGDSKIVVQTEELEGDERRDATEALQEFGEIEQLTEVSPTWGREISEKALRALVIFFVVIALYLTLRFEWKMAIAALAAVLHDIVVTVGVYAVTGFPVTPATVVAFLTILGFSLYDTVVVFDKIQENTAALEAARDESYSAMVNRSMNQVLMRSLNTSFVALLPVASLLFVGSYLFGAVSIRDFGLALFVGLLTGAYSSIFVATPLLAWWKEREPRYRALSERTTARAVRAAGLREVPTAGAPGTEPASAPAAATAATMPGLAESVTPRPRQQRGRKRGGSGRR